MSGFKKYTVHGEPGQKAKADARLNENNIDGFGRYTRLKASVSPVLAKAYFQQREDVVLTPPKIRM